MKPQVIVKPTQCGESGRAGKWWLWLSISHRIIHGLSALTQSIKLCWLSSKLYVRKNIYRVILIYFLPKIVATEDTNALSKHEWKILISIVKFIIINYIKLKIIISASISNMTKCEINQSKYKRCTEIRWIE